MRDHKPSSSGREIGEKGVSEAVVADQPSDAMVALYLQHVPDYLADFRAAIDQEDQQQLDFQCHKMCSAMRTMGFDNVAVILERLKDQDVSSDLVKEQGRQVEDMINHTLVMLSAG